MKFEFDTTNLKKQAEENPLLALGVFAAAATAGSKLMNTLVAAKNSRTYAKEVNRRIKKSK
jgi:hypothetical protein